MEELTQRQSEILRLVVEEYVATGQPVASKALVERSGLGRLIEGQRVNFQVRQEARGLKAVELAPDD